MLLARCRSLHSLSDACACARPFPHLSRSRTGETGAIAERMQGGRTDMINSGSASE